MKKLLVLAVLGFSTSAFSMGPDYKQTSNGGWVYTGGSHIKGCSNYFEVGKSTKGFVIECMKIDGINVRHPESVRTHRSKYSFTEIYVYGRTTFYFKDGILDYIIN